MIADRARPYAGAVLVLIGFFALVHAAAGAEMPSDTSTGQELGTPFAPQPHFAVPTGLDVPYKDGDRDAIPGPGAPRS